MVKSGSSDIDFQASLVFEVLIGQQLKFVLRVLNSVCRQSSWKCVFPINGTTFHLLHSLSVEPPFRLLWQIPGGFEACSSTKSESVQCLQREKPDTADSAPLLPCPSPNKKLQQVMRKITRMKISRPNPCRSAQIGRHSIMHQREVQLQ